MLNWPRLLLYYYIFHDSNQRGLKGESFVMVNSEWEFRMCKRNSPNGISCENGSWYYLLFCGKAFKTVDLFLFDSCSFVLACTKGM